MPTNCILWKPFVGYSTSSTLPTRVGNAFFLPIYRNRDSIWFMTPDLRIQTQRSRCHVHIAIISCRSQRCTTRNIVSIVLQAAPRNVARGHSKAFFKCDNCQEFTKSNMVKEYGGRYYCRKCQTKVLMPCVHCGGRFTKSYLKKTMDGEDVCESCATNRLPHCYNCGRAAFDSSCLSSNRDGVSMCIECVAKRLEMRIVQVDRAYASGHPSKRQDCAPLPGVRLSGKEEARRIGEHSGRYDSQCLLNRFAQICLNCSR